MFVKPTQAQVDPYDSVICRRGASFRSPAGSDQARSGHPRAHGFRAEDTHDRSRTRLAGIGTIARVCLDDHDVDGAAAQAAAGLPLTELDTITPMYEGTAAGGGHCCPGWWRQLVPQAGGVWEFSKPLKAECTKASSTVLVFAFPSGGSFVVGDTQPGTAFSASSSSRPAGVRRRQGRRS
jgi:hypothetical protein